MPIGHGHPTCDASHRHIRIIAIHLPSSCIALQQLACALPPSGARMQAVCTHQGMRHIDSSRARPARPLQLYRWACQLSRAPVNQPSSAELNCCPSARRERERRERTCGCRRR